MVVELPGVQSLLWMWYLLFAGNPPVWRGRGSDGDARLLINRVGTEYYDVRERPVADWAGW